MECNKDESIRAKSIAEDKIKKKDFPGAKKFALKARTLYPDLDGITQILTMTEVYISSENKISGETDWYGVLGVNPSSDDESIRKQYRKLALMLHPDKNKSVGADGAFNLISEAWNLLSDKAKRLSYNQRRGYRGQQQKAQMHAGGPSASRPNQTFDSQKTQNSVPNPKPKKPPTPAPNNKSSTFWTICFRCKMHYEYLKVYLNHTLLCPNCHEPFMATETSPPNSFSKSSNQAPPRHHGLNNHTPSQNSHDPIRQAQKSSPGYSHGKGNSVGTTDPSIAAKAANVVQQAQDKVRTHDPVRQAQRSGFGSDPLRYSHGKGNTFGSTDPSIYAKAANVVQQTHDKVNPVRHAQKSGLGSDSPRYSHGKGNNNVGGTEPSIAAKAANVIQQAQNKVKRAYNELHGAPSQAEVSAKKTKLNNNNNSYNSQYGMNYQNRAHGSNSSFGIGASGSKFHGASVVNRRPNSTRDLTSAETRAMLMKKSRTEILTMINTFEKKTTTPAATKTDDDKEKKDRSKERNDENKTTDTEEPVDESMIVPDPDFHDFDSDRTEASFGDNEVWAAYDDEDGMPRFYAMISKVISKKPFKVRIGWLNSKNTDEFGPLEWVGSGFYKTCGEFRVGKYETSKSINSFSQKVNWTKGSRGSILILPRKGDVWALYKNWSTSWTESTPDDVIYKYEMVMVLDDYDEVKGVSVAPLLKVDGFKTIFRPSDLVRKIPKEEMLRFSHRVPKFLLTGLEGSNAPKGCLELDPAATPLELLQVTN